MGRSEKLTTAIMHGTKSIFSNFGYEIAAMGPCIVPAGSVSGQVTALLTFRERISGSFCFKCSIRFANDLCEQMIGMDGTDNDYELLKDAVAEVLNWISGDIKRAYSDGDSIKISTPSVFVMEQPLEGPETEQRSTVLYFKYLDEKFSIEIDIDD